MWFNIFHNKTGNNISQGITSAYNICHQEKEKGFIRQTFTDTLLGVYKIAKINIFFRPEEAMFENWQKFVSTLKNICSVLENTKVTWYQTEWEVSICFFSFILIAEVKRIYNSYYKNGGLLDI